MTNTELTIENIEKLAKQIAKEYGISMDEARDLAEFKLRYAP